MRLEKGETFVCVTVSKLIHIDEEKTIGFAYFKDESDPLIHVEFMHKRPGRFDDSLWLILKQPEAERFLTAALNLVRKAKGK